MPGSGRESLQKVRVFSGGPPGCQGVVWRPSQMSWSGREASWMSGSGRKTLTEVREWSGGPHVNPRVDLRPSQKSGSGR